jgi:carbon-monoxide dehydrogenase medium subunit
MRAFDYLAPGSIDDALSALREHRGDAKVLAGGQSLVPLLNYRLARPRVVVDINALPLDDVRRTNGYLTLGALTRHATLVESAEIARACPVLGDAAALVGNVRVRTLGTLGGSLAHADPAGELPLVATLLDATLTLRSSAGTRTLGAGEFFTGPLSTALADDELLTEIAVPPLDSHGWAVEELSRRAGDFAIVAAAAIVSIDCRGRVDAARLAFGGVAGTPVRATRAEATLVGQEPTAERIGRVAETARADLDPGSDAFVSAAYRRHLAGVLARRALTRAVARALEVR